MLNLQRAVNRQPWSPRGRLVETARNFIVLRNEFALNPCSATIILKSIIQKRSQNCNKRWRSSQKAEPQISETMQNMIPEITSSIMLVSHAKNKKHHKAQLNNCHIALKKSKCLTTVKEQQIAFLFYIPNYCQKQWLAIRHEYQQMF